MLSGMRGDMAVRSKRHTITPYQALFGGLFYCPILEAIMRKLIEFYKSRFWEPVLQSIQAAAFLAAFFILLGWIQTLEAKLAGLM